MYDKYFDFLPDSMEEINAWYETDLDNNISNVVQLCHVASMTQILLAKNVNFMCHQ